MKYRYLFLLIVSLFIFGCSDSNKNDTINKTSKIDSGKTEESDGRKVYLHGDSSKPDSIVDPKDSIPD